MCGSVELWKGKRGQGFYLSSEMISMYIQSKGVS